MNRKDRIRKVAEILKHMDYFVGTFAGYHITTNETEEISAIIQVALADITHLLPKPPRPTIPVGERYVGARSGVGTSQHAAELVKPHILEFGVEILEVLLEWYEKGGTAQEVCFHKQSNFNHSESYSGAMSTLRRKGLTVEIGTRKSIKPTRLGKPGKATSKIHQITDEGIEWLEKGRAILSKGGKL